MRRALPLCALLAAPATAPAAEAAPFYEVHMNPRGDGPTHEASRGAGWAAVFRERAVSPVRYRVCVTHDDVPKVSRCFARWVVVRSRS
jgi:hypothetical protein